MLCQEFFLHEGIRIFIGLANKEKKKRKEEERIFVGRRETVYKQKACADHIGILDIFLTGRATSGYVKLYNIYRFVVASLHLTKFLMINLFHSITRH